MTLDLEAIRKRAIPEGNPQISALADDVLALLAELAFWEADSKASYAALVEVSATVEVHLDAIRIARECSAGRNPRAEAGAALAAEEDGNA